MDKISEEARLRGTMGTGASSATIPRILKKRYKTHQNLILGLTSVLGLLALWQLFVSFGFVDPVFTSTPKGVALSAVSLIQTEELWISTGVTMREFSLGFGVSALIGIPVGIMMGWYRGVWGLLNPLVSALYGLPRLALLPLLVLWFGIGMQARVVQVISVAILPIIVNTAVGVHVLDPALLRVARSFRASDLQIFRTVALPGSVPYILTGLRIGVGQGMVAVIAAELFIGNEGLGYLLAWYGASFLMANLMFVILVTGAIGIIFVELLSRIEKRFESWRPAVRE